MRAGHRDGGRDRKESLGEQVPGQPEGLKGRWSEERWASGALAPGGKPRSPEERERDLKRKELLSDLWKGRE